MDGLGPETEESRQEAMSWRRKNSGPTKGALPKLQGWLVPPGTGRAEGREAHSSWLPLQALRLREKEADKECYPLGLL